MNFEKSEIQSKYRLSYCKLSGNKKFPPQTIITHWPITLSLPHAPSIYVYKHKNWEWPRISQYGFYDLYEYSELTFSHYWHSLSLPGGYDSCQGAIFKNKDDLEFQYKLWFLLYIVKIITKRIAANEASMSHSSKWVFFGLVFFYDASCFSVVTNMMTCHH